MEIKRGTIYYADLEPVIGSEQGGIRPVLVIQNDIGNQHSPTIIVAPITSKNKSKYMPTHCSLPNVAFLEENSVALLEQIRTIDKKRLGTYLGELDLHAMEAIANAIQISLGLQRQKGRSDNASEYHHNLED